MAAPMLKFFSVSRFVQEARILRKITLTERSIIGCQRTFCNKVQDLYEDENLGFLPQDPKPHPETPAKGMYEIDPPKGKVYAKLPFQAVLVGGKKYYWCACGHSKQQPFCDGQHKELYRVLKNIRQDAVRFLPFKFKVEENKTAWICNCKQTNNRPFCDGAHKSLPADKKATRAGS